MDIRKFFDTLDHSHLRDLLKRRVRDGVLLRQRAAPDAEPETPGPLQLLRDNRELRHVEPCESASGGDLAEVARQAKLEGALPLVRPVGAAGAKAAAAATGGPLGVPQRCEGLTG